MENTDFKFPAEKRIRTFDKVSSYFIQESSLEDGSFVQIFGKIEPGDDFLEHFRQHENSDPLRPESLMVRCSRDLPPSDWLPELLHFIKLLTLLSNES